MCNVKGNKSMMMEWIDVLAISRSDLITFCDVRVAPPSVRVPNRDTESKSTHAIRLPSMRDDHSFQF